MGRDDLCFCMSGKKKKNCHADIHEESEAAAKLKIYNQLENDLKKLGLSIDNFDEKFQKPRSNYYNTLINNKTTL